MRLLRAGGIDWDEVERESRQRRIAGMTALSLGYLAEYLDAPIPRQVVERLARVGGTVGDRLFWRLKSGPRGLVALLLTPWLDLWRCCRPQGLLEALRELPDFLMGRWGLGSAWQLPHEVFWRLPANWRSRYGSRFPVASSDQEVERRWAKAGPEA